MKPRAISATYVKTYMTCLQQFYFRYYSDKEPFVSGEARAFGTAVHKGLEHMYTILQEKGCAPSESDYDEVIKVFYDSGLKEGLSDQALYEEGRDMLKSRLDAYDPTEKTVGLEILFGFPTKNPKIPVETENGTPLIGAIDRVFELDPSTLVVLDYKTSRTALTEEEALSDVQLSLYDLAASILWPEYKNIILCLDYLRLSPVITHRTKEQRASFSKFLDTFYQQVSDLKEEDIKPRLNVFCGWCDYRNYCPKYKKAISDPDMLVQPLETYSKEEFVDEWARFNNIKRVVENYRRELSMHASNIVDATGEKEIAGSKTSLYKVQRSRVFYDPATVLKIIPKKDQAKLMSVNKAALDKYLIDHPEYADAVSDTARVTFSTAFFKEKEKK